MKKTLLFSAFLTLFLSIGYGQSNPNEEFFDGWAVTTKGDTIRGKICYMNAKTGEIYQNEKKLIFIDEKGTRKKMGADKLSAFSVEDRIFEYHILDSGMEAFIAEKIKDGKIELYKAWYIDNKKSDKKKFVYEEAMLIRKEDDKKFTEVLQKDFKKIMKKFFNGDEKIMDMITENGWTAFDMEKIIDAYNNE